jgi:hypothetical protein
MKPHLPLAVENENRVRASRLFEHILFIGQQSHCPVHDLGIDMEYIADYRKRGDPFLHVSASAHPAGGGDQQVAARLVGIMLRLLTQPDTHHPRGVYAIVDKGDIVYSLNNSFGEQESHGHCAPVTGAAQDSV